MSAELTEEQWRRLDDLFAAARELPPEGQAAFARESLAGDAVLLAHLLGMLQHSANAAARIAAVIAGMRETT